MAETEEKLSASQRAKIRRISQPKELAPDEEGGELNIVPFLDIVTNVLMFVLATVAVTFTTMIDAQPPGSSSASSRSPTNPSLSLVVDIVHDGIVVALAGRRLAPGCQSHGSGMAVGMKTGAEGRDYDWAGLTECVKGVKAANPDAEGEHSVTLMADSDIQYQTIISAMDALRKSNDGELLFPDVNFSPGGI